MFTKADLKQLKKHGISEEEVLRQLELFKQGMPPLNLARPCTLGDGILSLPHERESELVAVYNEAADAGRISTFTPASGAASRMFRDLLALAGETDPLTLQSLELKAKTGNSQAAFGLRFFRNLHRFAFYSSLRETLEAEGFDLAETIESGDLRKVLEVLLMERGLRFTGLPKGLIPFHRHSGRVFTPFEEQLLEGVELVSDLEGNVRLHFTVSPSARGEVEKHLAAFVKEEVDDDFEVRIDFSVQKPSTDTIAVTPDNDLFRDKEGKLLLRPGGHGSLLENLNDLDADIVLIKNIDNVVPFPGGVEKFHRRKVLAGLLVQVQARLFDFVRRLEEGGNDALYEEAKTFAEQELSLHHPLEWDEMDAASRAAWLLDRMNRPIRVCGMVPNSGEPGGGPFWVREDGDDFSLQIVEASQIDLKDETQRRVFESSTHFNPVDIACGLRDTHGKPFDLQRFQDPQTAFIAKKSYNGRPLKALERPGLWNGAMAKWITLFVELPASSFTPVKTVNDLLREEHRTAEGEG